MEPRLEEKMPAPEIPGQRRKSFKRTRGNNSEHSSYIVARNRIYWKKQQEKPN
ncbi:MAG: hypothetical protein M3297_13595 [Thermoproteota archaeon]|jgi:hypothetical protein|nr:hypothetical protein [Thermoproteota archaeon]